MLLCHQLVDKEVNTVAKSIDSLSDMISTKFKTDAAFGIAMGWVPQKVSKLKSGKYIPKIGEAAKMSRVLDVSLETVASFFAP